MSRRSWTVPIGQLRHDKIPRCAHGFDFPEERCADCIDTADEQRWIDAERRQIDAMQFSLDMRVREFDRRRDALARKSRPRRTK